MNQEAGSIVIFSRNEEGEKIFSEYQDEENLIKDLAIQDYVLKNFKCDFSYDIIFEY